MEKNMSISKLFQGKVRQKYSMRHLSVSKQLSREEMVSRLADWREGKKKESRLVYGSRWGQPRNFHIIPEGSDSLELDN